MAKVIRNNSRPAVTITLAGAGSTGDPAGTAATLVDAHEAAADPHPGYVLESAIGTTVQPHHVDLDALSGISSAGGGFIFSDGIGSWGIGNVPQSDITLEHDLAAIENLSGTGWAKRTGTDTWTLSTPTAADVGAQATDAGLTSLLSVDTGADVLPYTTGANAWAGTMLTSWARTLLDDADAGTARTTLGIVGGSGSLITPTNTRYDPDLPPALTYVAPTQEFATSQSDGGWTNLWNTGSALSGHVIGPAGLELTTVASNTGLIGVYHSTFPAGDFAVMAKLDIQSSGTAAKIGLCLMQGTGATDDTYFVGLYHAGYLSPAANAWASYYTA